jgi:hypothetical protein
MRAAGTVATRKSRPNEARAMSRVFASAACTSCSKAAGTQNALPSPSKMNGMSVSPAAFSTAVTAAAATVLTCL